MEKFKAGQRVEWTSGPKGFEYTSRATVVRVLADGSVVVREDLTMAIEIVIPAGLLRPEAV